MFLIKDISKLSLYTQSLIADVFQAAEQPKKNTRYAIIKRVQDSYIMYGEAKNDIDFPKTVSSDDENAEYLKEKVSRSMTSPSVEARGVLEKTTCYKAVTP